MSTLLKLGYSNPLTDAFGAHPLLGAVLDLNDGATFTLTYPDGLQLGPPPKTLVTAGNIRTQGERATRAIYRHNREVRAGLILGPMSNYANVTAAIRLLLSWLNAPPSIPFSIQYQPPGASAPVYLDVVGAAHSLSEDEEDWLRLMLEPVEITFLCRPGLRGDRVWLQNLVVNPGFEAPSGPGVTVFNDAFATANAYALVAGSAPTLAANVLTLPAGTLVTFGSPAWGLPGGINQWVLRFQMPSGGAGGLNAYLHYVDGSDYLRVNILSTGLIIQHMVAGSSVNVATSGALTTTAGNWYWLVVTQFPTVAGDPAYVSAALYADSSPTPGSKGALVTGSSIAGATQEIGSIGSTVALSGVMALQNSSGASIGLGGAYSNVHTVSLFGPGGWYFVSGTGVYAESSGAWEGAGQSPTNCISPAVASLVPVQSFGAGRVDCAPGPAGQISAYWNGADVTSASSILNTAYPTAGNVGFSAAAWVRSVGVGPACAHQLIVQEYTSSGGFVKATVVQQATGPQGGATGWTQLSGSLTTQPTTAYVFVSLRVQDVNAGASASGTVWWENVQLWLTSKGASQGTSMPYCELRFPQSPARLLVSGLLGDLPAPAFLAVGTLLASWPTGSLLNVALGRRGQVSPALAHGPVLVGPSNGYYGAALPPTAVCVLDASSYGGYYAQASVTGSGWNPRAFSFTPADAPGVYHLFARLLTQQAAGNLGNVEVRVGAQQRSQPWFGQPSGADVLGTYFGPFVYPFTASNAWQVIDGGQFPVPPLPAGALSDPTQTYLTPRPNWADTTGGGSVCQAGWQALLPIDGSLVMGVINNPSNAPFGLTNEWLWAYFDGLGVPSNQPVAWTTSVESGPVHNPAHAGGGPGTTGSGAINVNSGADPSLTLDPTLAMGGGVGGVNELVGVLYDGNAAVLPLYGEIAYSPLYLYPR